MKRVIICGAGEVGRHTAEILTEEGHKVTVIDVSGSRLRELEEHMDVTSIKASCCYPDTLRDAKASSCDLLVAATIQDEMNLLTAALGKRMGAARVVARIHERNYMSKGAMDYGE